MSLAELEVSPHRARSLLVLRRPFCRSTHSKLWLQRIFIRYFAPRCLQNVVVDACRCSVRWAINPFRGRARPAALRHLPKPRPGEFGGAFATQARSYRRPDAMERRGSFNDGERANLAL